MQKKLYIILFCIVLMIGLGVNTGKNMATDAYAADLSIAVVSAKPGETIGIPVSLNSNGQIAGIQFDLEYDKQNLSLDTKVVKGALLANEDYVVDSNSIDKGMRIIVYSPGGKTITGGQGTAISIPLHISNTVSSGTSLPLIINNLTISDADGVDITNQASVNNGEVTVSPATELWPAPTVQEAIIQMQPGNQQVARDKSAWVLQMVRGTLKNNLLPEYIDIVGLPNGLQYNLTKAAEQNSLIISVSGLATDPIDTISEIEVSVKASAFTDSEARDTETIKVMIEPCKDCFIATAAYGSYIDPHVWVLRHFRDTVLVNSSFGRWFISEYYHYSPPMAGIIRQSPGLRLGTRLLLTPVIFCIEYPMLLVLLLVLLVGLVGYRRVRLRQT